MNCEHCCPQCEAEILLPQWQRRPDGDFDAYQKEYIGVMQLLINYHLKTREDIFIVSERPGIGSTIIRAKSEEVLERIAWEIGGTILSVRHCGFEKHVENMEEDVCAPLT